MGEPAAAVARANRGPAAARRPDPVRQGTRSKPFKCGGGRRAPSISLGPTKTAEARAGGAGWRQAVAARGSRGPQPLRTG